jgi:3,4-dihydroxy 2-butanone 4-phosphate synthase
LCLGSGEFIIVLDSAARENEGDLIAAASTMTASKMAFMIRYTSGLICVPMSHTKITALALPQMVAENTESHGTAYTVSVDVARPGMTTGISAEDRAATCVALADPNSQSTHFRRPGHIFPLRAQPGGVRERAGHTEAAVELCHLAGVEPVAAICELVVDGEEQPGMPEMIGGGMMRRDGCLAFGQRWGLKVCTISGLVEYLDQNKL